MLLQKAHVQAQQARDDGRAQADIDPVRDFRKLEGAQATEGDFQHHEQHHQHRQAHQGPLGALADHPVDDLLKQQGTSQGKQLGQEAGQEHLKQLQPVAREVGQQPGKAEGLTRGMAADPQVHKAGLLQDPLLGLRQGDPLDAPAGVEQIHRLTACGDQQQGPVLLAPPKAGHGQPGNLAGPAHGHHEGIEAQLVCNLEQPRFQAVDGQPVEGITRLPHNVAPNRDLEMVDQR